MDAAKNDSKEIKITRIYDAPLKLVWEVWTDPAHVAKWWGPRGFTLTTHAKDFKPGGIWHYTMHGPDGQDYPNKTVYLEVEKHKRLVYDHGGYDDRPPLFRVTVLFSELDGKTKMDMTMTLPTAEAAAETRKFIKKANGNSTWDRLAEYLAKDLHGKDQFVINRSFNVPPEVMFEMWTNPDHLAKWLPPVGFTMEVLNGSIKEGDGALYRMTDGGRITMYGRSRYLEIKPNDRLVYTQQFCDETGNVSRHPMAPVWPETMLTTVTFAPEGESATRITVTWECHGAVKIDELKAFIAEKAGMTGGWTGGWTGTFDKLEDYLANL